MHRQLEMYGAGSHDTEVYSPPRVTAWAERMRMVPGLALDLTCVDPDDGKPWDFNDPDKADKVRRIVQQDKPLLLIGSPMCSAFSQMNRINFARMSKEDVDKVIEYGTRHLELCMGLYRMQMKMDYIFCTSTQQERGAGRMSRC